VFGGATLAQMTSPLDEDFPLGEGTADLDASVVCPYCGEEALIALDPGSGSSQSYVEDCPVCCQPWQVEVIRDRDGDWYATLRTGDE